MWHRWDPHIHSPGTIHEDRFGGDWEGYLTAVETSDPPIRVLGVTDYCVLDGYEAVVAQQKTGRLKNVDLIFPNVELRYDQGLPWSCRHQRASACESRRPGSREED